MEYFFLIVPKLAELLCLIVTGVLAVRLKIITQENKQLLSDLLMKIILPFLTFSLLCERGITVIDIFSFGRFLIWMVCLYPVLVLAGILSCKLAGIKYPQDNVHCGSMITGNYAYVVIPLVYALFEGDDAATYIPLCATIDTIMVWTVGISMYTKSSGHSFKLNLKPLCNPILGAVTIGLLYNSLNLSMPDVMWNVLDGIGEMSFTLGMIYLGATLCFMKHHSIENLKHMLVFVITKLFIVPLLVYVVTSRFLAWEESIILMLIAAAPTATISPILAKQYGLDEEYAAEIVSGSTLGCMFTVPLLFACIGMM